MKENNAAVVVEGLKQAAINYVVYMPDSFFFDVIKLVERDPAIQSISVPNEAIGLSMCAGAWLGGKKPAMLMENSGLLLSAYAITRLHNAFGIPVLLLISYRGDVGDGFWWSGPLGHVTVPVLNALSIPYVCVRKAEEAKDAIIDSQASLDVADEPRAVLFGGVNRW